MPNSQNKQGEQTRLEGAQPCPFCGSTWIVKGERYFAMCVDCGATGPERNGDATKKKFTGDWNSRILSQQHAPPKPNIVVPDTEQNDKLESQLAEAKKRQAWQPIENPPSEYETVLTIHQDDLFPVCAFRLFHDGRNLWMRQIEGPEDSEHPAQNEQLFRPPTHWMERPENPTP